MSGSPAMRRDETVDAHREATVRRRAHRERVEQEAELRLLLLLAMPIVRKTRCCISASWIRIEPEPSSQPFQIRS